MFGTKFFAVGFLVGVMAVLMFALPAFAQLQTVQNQKPTPAASTSDNATIQLSPITVRGRRLYLPTRLQTLKTALNQPVNFDSKNMAKLVCSMGHGAYRIPKMHCSTICQIWLLTSAVLGRVYLAPSNCYGWKGLASYKTMKKRYKSLRVARWVNSHNVNRGPLLKLLNKLPPAKSSYTLRITDHGKVVAKYVIKHGKVTKIWRAENYNDD